MKISEMILQRYDKIFTMKQEVGLQQCQLMAQAVEGVELLYLRK